MREEHPRHAFVEQATEQQGELPPQSFPVNMYELSSWARGTLFALMVMQARKPAIALDWRQGVLELYMQPPHFTKFKMPRGSRLFARRRSDRPHVHTAQEAYD